MTKEFLANVCDNLLWSHLGWATGKAQWNSTRINLFFFWVIIICGEGGKKQNKMKRNKTKPIPCPKAVLQELLLWHRQQAASEVPTQGEKCAWSHCQGMHRKTKSGSSSELFSTTVDSIAADGNKSVYQTERQYVLLQVGQWCTDQGSTGIYIIHSNSKAKGRG